MKIFTIIALLFVSITMSAQNIYYQSENLVVISGDTEYKQRTNVIVQLNTNEQRVVIHSKEAQIIDYEIYDIEKDLNGYTDVYCNATDTNYKNIILWIRYKDDYAMFAIIYNDVSYAYYTKYIPDRER